MKKRIIASILTIFVIISMYSYVFAKYIEKQYIHIAEVNIEKAQIERTEYILKVYYINQETNKAMKVQISSVYEGDRYDVDILDFEGYTYLYSNGDISGIMKKNLNILLYYKKS